MKRLKEPFGKAGLTVAVLALVLAMVGGAYAAGGLTKSQEKQVTKIAKKYAGKPGANGTNGSPGAKGDPGAAGAAGAPGAPGTSVTVTESSSAFPGGHCNGTTNNGKGGTELKVGAATPAYACNGKEGKEGTFGGESLPSGKTLTGTYGAAGFGEAGALEPGEGQALAGVTFALPVSGNLTSHYVSSKLLEEIQQGVPGGRASAGCTGTAEAPGAAAGNLCVFGQSEVNLAGGAPIVTLAGGPGDFFGASIHGLSAAKGGLLEAGSWAVTAQ